MTTPPRPVGCLLIAIGLGLLLLIALLVVPDVGAQTWRGAYADGGRWWAWVSDCTEHPVVTTLPAGQGQGWCQMGTTTVRVTPGARLVWVDGRQVAWAVWAPTVGR